MIFNMKKKQLGLEEHKREIKITRQHYTEESYKKDDDDVYMAAAN